MAGRRVLITGVAGALGAALAARLARDPGVERVIGVDTRPLEAGLAERIDLIAADLRAPDLGDRVASSGADVVIHNDVLQLPEAGRPSSAQHHHNVIGTQQLLKACSAHGDQPAHELWVSAEASLLDEHRLIRRAQDTGDLYVVVHECGVRARRQVAVAAQLREERALGIDRPTRRRVLDLA